MMIIEEKNSCDSVGVKVECWLQLILIILYFFHHEKAGSISYQLQLKGNNNGASWKYICCPVSLS